MRIAKLKFVAALVAVLITQSAAPLAAQPLPAPGASTASGASGVSASQQGCQVIARIDGEVVLASEVLWYVNGLLAENADRIPPEQMAEIHAYWMRRHLASMIDRKLLYAEFVRSMPAENLPRIEENLEEPFKEQELPHLMEQMGVENEHDLQQKLLSLGGSIEDARRAFNEKVIAAEWMRSKVKVDDTVRPDEMLDYYHEHLADYEFPTQARWEEVMVRKARFDSPAAAYAELAEMGNDVWNQVVANPDLRGPAFTEVAKAKSNGPNADQGGQYDWTTQGALAATEIDEALFSLELGQLSPILESDHGFHIVRVLERKEAGRRPFTEVQGEIRDRLVQQRRTAAAEKYFDELRSKSRIWTVFSGQTSAAQFIAGSVSDTQQR